MKYKVNDRIHTKALGVAAAHVPFGHCLVVATYEHLEIITVKSEITGKEYNVIL